MPPNGRPHGSTEPVFFEWEAGSSFSVSRNGPVLPAVVDFPLLTSTERVTLEVIRDTGVVSRERLAWREEKVCVEAVSKARHKGAAARR
jgi:hypothetical protein